MWRAFVQGAMTHAAAKKPESAAILSGFSQALLDRDVAGLHTVELEPYKASMDEVRKELGDHRFKELAQVGRLMSRREADATLADL